MSVVQTRLLVQAAAVAIVAAMPARAFAQDAGGTVQQANPAAPVQTANAAATAQPADPAAATAVNAAPSAPPAQAPTAVQTAANQPQNSATQTVKNDTGEIIVTARRRAENIMNVPSGISVIDQKALETKQIAGLADLGRTVPSLNIFEGVTQALFGITMRGIPTVQGAEPSVAMVVDGIQTPGISFFNQDLEGAQSIEVLRGPQGALYGRGAIAGVILINTKQPTNDFAGDVRALAGNGDTEKLSSTISGPLVRDKLLFRLSGSYNHFGGIVENVGYHGKADSDHSWNVRPMLVFTPSDQTKVTLKADYQNLWAIANDWEIVNRSQIYDWSILPDFNIKPFEKRWDADGSMKIEQDAGFGTFLSISQYSRQKDRIYGDADFSPGPFAVFAQTINTKALNEDFRFSAPKSDKFNWLVGVFYQERKEDKPLLVTGQPGGPLDGLILLNSNQFDRSRTYAAYAQSTLTLGHLDINLAARYDIEKRMQLDHQIAGSQVNATFRALQPQASLTYRFSDNFTTYVSYGRGFRSGGFNAAADTAVPHPNAPYPVLREFPKETTDNFEAGFKSRFFDRKLLLNVSAYHTLFKNQQYFYFFLVPTPARDIVSIPRSTINGLEVEGSWLPTRDFRIDFGMALTDARIKDKAYYNKYVAMVYRRTFNLGGEYSIDLDSRTRLHVRADYQRLGPIYYDLQNTYLYKGTDLLSGRISVTRGPFELAAFGRNLLDVRFPANFLADGIAPNISFRRRMRPRTFGAELRAHF